MRCFPDRSFETDAGQKWVVRESPSRELLMVITIGPDAKPQCITMKVGPDGKLDPLKAAV